MNLSPNVQLQGKVEQDEDDLSVRLLRSSGAVRHLATIFQTHQRLPGSTPSSQFMPARWVGGGEQGPGRSPNPARLWGAPAGELITVTCILKVHLPQSGAPRHGPARYSILKMP